MITGEDRWLLQILRVGNNTTADDFAIRLQGKTERIHRPVPRIECGSAAHAETGVDAGIRMVTDQDKAQLHRFFRHCEGFEARDDNLSIALDETCANVVEFSGNRAP